MNIVFINKNQWFDEKAFSILSQLVSDSRTEFFQVITFFGGYTFLVPANLVLIIYLLYRKNTRFAKQIAVISLSSLCLKFLFKLSFQRARPGNPLLSSVSGYSFPSGHALMSMVFYGLLIYISMHKVSNHWLRIVIIILLSLLIITISFSRIYLRLHYTTDVLAGLSIGYIWLIVSIWAMKKIESDGSLISTK